MQFHQDQKKKKKKFIHVHVRLSHRHTSKNEWESNWTMQRTKKCEQITLFKTLPKWSFFNAFPMRWVIHWAIEQILIIYM